MITHVFIGFFCSFKQKMKIHTTNYFNTLIEPAEDCPVSVSEIPPRKEEKLTVANLQYDLLKSNPNQLTSDDVLFQVFAERNAISDAERQLARADFFSKGQPCFRASPLTKRYGWGIFYDNEGKMTLLSIDSERYLKLLNDEEITKVKAMRNAKK